DDLRAELALAEAGVVVGVAAAQPVVDVERGHLVAELAKREGETGRVGPAGDEAQHLATRSDQVTRADVRFDPLEDFHPRNVTPTTWGSRPTARAISRRRRVPRQ